MFKNWFPYFFETSSDGPSGGDKVGEITPPSGKEGVEGDIDILKEGEEIPSEEIEIEGEEDEEQPQPEETDEETQETEEEAPDEDEEETDEEVAAVPEIKAIKKDFPELFKKYPEVRAAIFRDAEYSKVFVNPKDAKNAADVRDIFHQMENDIIINGDPTRLLSTIKQAKPESLDKFGAAFLPALRQENKDLYNKIVAVPIKQLLRAALKSGKNSSDKNLEYAAVYLNRFAFGDDEVTNKVDGEKEPEKKSAAQTEYEKKLDDLNRRDHSDAKQAVDTQFVSEIQTLFEEGLDPNNTMSEWMRKKLIESGIMELDKQLSADARHMNFVESLWKGAQRSGYKGDFKAKIINASLARAKSLIPEIRAKLRREAFAKTSGDKKKVIKRIVPSSTSGHRGGKEITAKDANEKKMSDLEILRS